MEGFQAPQTCRRQGTDQALVPDLTRMRQDGHSASLLDQLDRLERTKVSARNEGRLPLPQEEVKGCSQVCNVSGLDHRPGHMRASDALATGEGQDPLLANRNPQAPKPEEDFAHAPDSRSLK
jgi:hypothetical protein